MVSNLCVEKVANLNIQYSRLFITKLTCDRGTSVTSLVEINETFKFSIKKKTG